MKRSIIYLVLLICVSTPANACIGARHAAMGWCGVAMSDDATASYWNPAAMVWAKDGVMYDTIWDRTALAWKYNNFGFHYVDELDKWYCRIGYGYQLNKNLAVGFNVGWAEYNNCYPPYNGPSADLSLIYRNGDFSLGLLAQNIGNIRPEIAYNTEHFTVAAGFYDLFDSIGYFYKYNPYRRLCIGAEIRPVSFLALRGGYISNYNNLTYGVAIKTSFLTLDYVRIEEVNCFSITCIF